MDSSHAAATAATATGGAGNSMMVSQSMDASPVDSLATTAATPFDDPKQNLSQAINSIQKTLGILHQLYLTVSSYSVASQLPLLQRMNNLVLELDNMTRLADKCNIQVPMEVLNLIDDGKNPDEFSRDMLNCCIAKNQITKGKTDAFKGLRRHLLEELEQAFPGEVETYREIRAASAAYITLRNGENGYITCVKLLRMWQEQGRTQHIIFRGAPMATGGKTICSDTKRAS